MRYLRADVRIHTNTYTSGNSTVERLIWTLYDVVWFSYWPGVPMSNWLAMIIPLLSQIVIPDAYLTPYISCSYMYKCTCTYICTCVYLYVQHNLYKLENIRHDYKSAYAIPCVCTLTYCFLVDQHLANLFQCCYL